MVSLSWLQVEVLVRSWPLSPKVCIALRQPWKPRYSTAGPGEFTPDSAGVAIWRGMGTSMSTSRGRERGQCLVLLFHKGSRITAWYLHSMSEDPVRARSGGLSSE